LKPAFGYHGGKGRYAAWILEHLPEADCYVEPFAGSAAVLFAKPPSRVEVLNDLDTEVWAFLTALRDFPDELERACRLTPYSRHEFRTVRQSIDEVGCTDIVERARRFFVIVSQGFAAVPATKGWSRPEPDLSEALKAIRLIDRFQACAARLLTVHLECLDALEVLRRYDSAKTVFFIDPPYLWSTRSWANRQRTKQDYRVEMMSNAEHEQLLEAVSKVTGAVALAGRSSPLYDAALSEWKRVDGKSREVLWIKE
jgi:DNA adenine methylase